MCRLCFRHCFESFGCFFLHYFHFLGWRQLFSGCRSDYVLSVTCSKNQTTSRLSLVINYSYSISCLHFPNACGDVVHVGYLWWPSWMELTSKVSCRSDHVVKVLFKTIQWFMRCFTNRIQLTPTVNAKQTCT